MSKIPPLYAAILAGVFLVCATVAGILIPTERWEKLGHFLTDPATALALTALGGAFVALYTRARNLPPAAVLLVALLGASVSGCGASVPVVIATTELVVKGTCAGAAKLCELVDSECRETACHVVHDVCGALPIDATVQLACEPAETSGDEVTP